MELLFFVYDLLLFLFLVYLAVEEDAYIKIDVTVLELGGWCHGDDVA